MRKKPKLLILASGSAEGGGSGFENLVQASRQELFQAEIVGVVSNHLNGGVRQRADKLGIPFIYFPGPWTGEEYQRLAQETKADFFGLSGWLKLTKGLDLKTSFNSRTVFNIHPGPLPDFGGPGFYGHHIHEAVLAAFKRGDLTHTALSMHFVTEEYDQGPIFFKLKIKINDDDTVETLAQRVNKLEHQYQPVITNLVVNGLIHWDGINLSSLKVPNGYLINQ